MPDITPTHDREKVIIRTSIVGVICNLILAGLKITVGTITNSVAVLMDGVNSLSDVLASVITIVGTWLSGRAPDQKHPYGYGRIEYLTSVLVAGLVLAAGITAAKESILTIIHPRSASYSVVMLVVIAAGIVIRFCCGRYVSSIGKRLNAGALIAAGSDAFFDSVLSSATLIAALINRLTNIQLEGILGVVISVVIIRAGLGMLTEALHTIIGERADNDLTTELKNKIKSYDGVRGVFDVVMHNYGPSTMLGTAHIELADSMSAREIHGLSRRIIRDVYKENGIVLTIGIYAANETNEKERVIKNALLNLTKKEEGVLQTHAFYVDEEEKTVTFDVVTDFKFDGNEIRKRIETNMKEQFPEYQFLGVAETNFSL